MTPVALFSEVDDGTIRFYADVPRNAPTIRALQSILIIFDRDAVVPRGPVIVNLSR
jgi:hypothetical protein